MKTECHDPREPRERKAVLFNMYLFGACVHVHACMYVCACTCVCVCPGD